MSSPSFLARNTYWNLERNCFSLIWSFCWQWNIKLFTVSPGPETETTSSEALKENSQKGPSSFSGQNTPLQKKTCLLAGLPPSIKHSGWQNKITRGHIRIAVDMLKVCITQHWVPHSALSTTPWLYPILYSEKQQPPTATHAIIRQIPFIPGKLSAA